MTNQREAVPRPSMRARVLAGILGAVLVFGLAACDEDDPSTTSAPGGSDTTEPVGS
jgi:hypothetical protein